MSRLNEERRAYARAQMDHAQVEKLQGQKMRAYTEHKKRMSAEVTFQRVLLYFMGLFSLLLHRAQDADERSRV